MDVIITYAYMNIFKTPVDQDSNCLHECQDNICMPLIMHVNIFKTAMDGCVRSKSSSVYG